MARSRFSVAVLPLLLCATACVDLTPVTLGSADAGLSSDAAPSGNACERCLFGERPAQCAAQLAACDEDSKCPGIMQCLFDTDCTRSSNHETVNRCSLPCVLNAGVTSPDDPGVVRAILLSNCSAEACPGRCYHEP
jgi:hypothetical protein